MIQLEVAKGEMKDMFEKLLEKLKELFQLNQPELDFGIYRIMHAFDQYPFEISLPKLYFKT